MNKSNQTYACDRQTRLHPPLTYLQHDSKVSLPTCPFVLLPFGVSMSVVTMIKSYVHRRARQLLELGFTTLSTGNLGRHGQVGPWRMGRSPCYDGGSA
jgi:hypothetical protein